MLRSGLGLGGVLGLWLGFSASARVRVTVRDNELGLG